LPQSLIFFKLPVVYKKYLLPLPSPKKRGFILFILKNR
jgi:hypothetical protein